jgi:hypothetical protein
MYAGDKILAADDDAFGPFADDDGPECADCGDEITGAIWTGGRCLSCHEAAMLPPESGADYMPGWGE